MNKDYNSAPVEPLKPTNKVDGREQRVWKMSPSPTRKRDRSKTYEANIIQWGEI